MSNIYLVRSVQPFSHGENTCLQNVTDTMWYIQYNGCNVKYGLKTMQKKCQSVKLHAHVAHTEYEHLQWMPHYHFLFAPNLQTDHNLSSNWLIIASPPDELANKQLDLNIAISWWSLYNRTTGIFWLVMLVFVWSWAIDINVY